MRTTRVMKSLAGWGAVAVVGLAVGCGPQPEGDAQGNETARPVIAKPADPDTLISFTVLGVDRDGKIVPVRTSKITKGEQWRLMTERTIAPAPIQSSDGVTRVQGAVALETCWHGSPLVLNDAANFGGNYMCFNANGGAFNLFDIDTVNPSFVTRSAYSLMAAYLRDAAQVIQVTWCGDALHQINSYTGNRIRYTQTPGQRTGPCHI